MRTAQKHSIIKSLLHWQILASILITIAGFLFLNSCTSTSGTKKGLPEKPSWMDTRPVSSMYYYGIGSALKKGSADRYRNQARENALSEMAGQINTQISSTMELYKVEDRFGVREMLQNRIRTESKEFLEGYEYMDQWEDETRYYTIYRLSKTVFEQNKEKRKKMAADGAYLKYQQAINHLHGRNYLMAYSFFVQTLEGIKDYLGEGVVVETPQGYHIDLGNGSLTYLDDILKELRIKSNQNNIIITGEEPENNIIFTVTDKQNHPVSDVPVKFNYSGGYLLIDTSKSNEEGQVVFPEFKAPVHSARETLTAVIDVQAIARNVTFDIDIRRMLEKWNTASAKVQIEFVR